MRHLLSSFPFSTGRLFVLERLEEVALQCRALACQLPRFSSDHLVLPSFLVLVASIFQPEESQLRVISDYCRVKTHVYGRILLLSFQERRRVEVWCCLQLQQSDPEWSEAGESCR